MTTMFAGIPLEGSGIRPLEADLYGADQQPVDYENISATGNLNIGNVIHYDEHATRSLTGAIAGDDAVRNLSVAAPESATHFAQPETLGTPRSFDAVEPSSVQTTEFNGPNSLADTQTCHADLPKTITPIHGVSLYKKPLMCRP